ncbi:MAG TPA: pyridoxal-phosphate dependent enzyme [Xylella sp.]
MVIHSSVLELIGNTPIVKAKCLNTGLCDLFFKLESTNPGGSIKDRIAVSIIEAAERRGHIKPGATLVDGAVDSTSLGLAFVARQKGYHLILVVPDKMSRENISHLKAMRAEVILTRSDVIKGHPEHYQDLAAKIAAETPDGYFINQGGNPDSLAAHEFGTGPEILRQMGGHLDTIVMGCDSAGTITGLSRAFDSVGSAIELILADPVGSILTQYINAGTVSDMPGIWLVEGIGCDSLPSLFDFSRIKKAYAISDAESFQIARELLSKEGILGGSSTGTVLAAALRYCREQTEYKRVLVFVDDAGNKYSLNEYNDDGMLDDGFLSRPHYGDLRDLILRPYSQRHTVVADPNDMLTLAYQRMRLYDVSQLPVIEDNQIVGIVDESDVLLHVYGDETRFCDPVSTAMVSKLDRLDVKSPVEALLPVFERGQVAIVMDGAQFLGLITRIDLLNYLRRRVQ